MSRPRRGRGGRPPATRARAARLAHRARRDPPGGAAEAARRPARLRGRRDEAEAGHDEPRRDEGAGEAAPRQERAVAVRGGRGGGEGG